MKKSTDLNLKSTKGPASSEYHIACMNFKVYYKEKKEREAEWRQEKGSEKKVVDILFALVGKNWEKRCSTWLANYEIIRRIWKKKHSIWLALFTSPDFYWIRLIIPKLNLVLHNWTYFYLTGLIFAKSNLVLLFPIVFSYILYWLLLKWTEFC